MRQLCLFLSFLWLLSCSLAQAASLEPVIWHTLLDASRQQTLDSVRSLPNSAWKTETSPLVSYGYSRANLWLWGKLSAGKEGTYILELANPQMDFANLYLLHGDGRREIMQQGSWQQPSASSLDKYHNQVFELHLQEGENVTVYLQVSAARSLIVWPRFSSETGFVHQGLAERFWIGSFAGLFVALIVYCLLVWRAARDGDFLNYVFFLISNGLLQMHLLGILHEFIPIDSPWMMQFLGCLLSTLVFVSIIHFTRAFLDLQQYSRKADRILCYMGWLCGAMLGLFLFGSAQYFIPVANLMGVVVISTSLAIGFVVWSRGYQPARFYLLAQAALGFGGVCYVLVCAGLIPATPWTLYSFQISSAVEVLLMAISLADKIHILNRDKNKAQSERLYAEQRMVEILRESESNLEQRVKERTGQLEQALILQQEQGEILAATNQQLRALNEEKSAILSIAAHDLKNPTAAIMSFVHLIQKHWHDYDDEKKLKRLTSIYDLAQLIHKIISNLLDVNAIETGRYPLNPEIFNPGALCKSLYEQYRERAEFKGIRLHFQEASDLQVWADKAAIRQVMDNLLSNAIKYSSSGGSVWLLIDGNGERVNLAVRDDGPGLSDADQEKLYRKFTRLSARPTAGEHSSGLGLSIVQRIMKASGGDVVCKSRLGEGATFTIDLPRSSGELSSAPWAE